MNIDSNHILGLLSSIHFYHFIEQSRKLRFYINGCRLGGALTLFIIRRIIGICIVFIVFVTFFIAAFIKRQ